MLSDLMGLIVCVAPIVGLLMWREHGDRREQAAGIVRADIHAGVTKALEGESLLAIQVEGPTAWRAGQVTLSTPSGYESLIGQASRSVFERLPSGYDVVIHCGGGT
jgi:hypothetical protein